MHRVLFVCTGNVFRSLAAELALSAAPSGRAFHFSSAGTHAGSQRKRSDVRERLTHHGLDYTNRTPRLLTPEILAQTDLIVAMSEDRKNYITQHFNRQAVLFPEVATDRPDSILDLPDVAADYKNRRDESRVYVHSAIDLIVKSRDEFLKRLPRYLPAHPPNP